MAGKGFFTTGGGRVWRRDRWLGSAELLQIEQTNHTHRFRNQSVVAVGRDGHPPDRSGERRAADFASFVDVPQAERAIPGPLTVPGVWGEPGDGDKLLAAGHDGDAVDERGMPQERFDDFRFPQVPEMNPSVERSEQDLGLAQGRQVEVVQKRRFPKRCRRLFGLHIPDAQGFLTAAGHQQVAVPRKGDVPKGLRDISAVVVHHPRFEVPHANSEVAPGLLAVFDDWLAVPVKPAVRAARQELAIRGESQAADLTRVPQGPTRLARLDVVQVDGAVADHHGKSSAIRRNRGVVQQAPGWGGRIGAEHPGWIQSKKAR